MQIYEAIAARKSVRSFRPDSVEPEKIDRILAAARLAPSARNEQEWRFLVLDQPGLIRSVAESAAGSYAFVAEAPVMIVICAVTDKAVMRCGHLRFTVDCAAAVDHLMLAAVEEGLGSCWIGGFAQAPVKEILDIPEEVEVFALLPVGYPRHPEPAVKQRKPLEELVCRNRWTLL